MATLKKLKVQSPKPSQTDLNFCSVGDAKPQAPSPRLQISFKPQTSAVGCCAPPGLKCGAWNFSVVWSLVFGVFILGSACFASAAETAIPDLPRVTAGEASNRVHRAYVEFSERFAREPTNSQTAWQFARACFNHADFATNDNQRAAIAEQGIAASRRAILLAPDTAAAHFYLGVNLGQLARTKLFSALGLLDEMESAWKKSIDLDAKFNHAAAHRSLGLLYLDAPGWPLSLGNRTKARRHLQKAAELDSGYPENRLCLLEARLRWGEARAVQGQFAAMESTLQFARTNYTGEAWACDWEDWDARWKKIKAKAGTTANARSPRAAR